MSTRLPHARRRRLTVAGHLRRHGYFAADTGCRALDFNILSCRCPREPVWPSYGGVGVECRRDRESDLRVSSCRHSPQLVGFRSLGALAVTSGAQIEGSLDVFCVGGCQVLQFAGPARERRHITRRGAQWRCELSSRPCHSRHRCRWSFPTGLVQVIRASTSSQSPQFPSR